VRKDDNLPPYCAVVTKSGILKFLEPSGPVQACNGTVLPSYFFTGSEFIGSINSHNVNVYQITRQ